MPNIHFYIIIDRLLWNRANSVLISKLLLKWMKVLEEGNSSVSQPNYKIKVAKFSV